MLMIANYNLEKNRVTDFQKWVKKNEKLYAEHAPKGWKYRGTYFYVMGFGQFTAAEFWECKDYADLDTWRNHADPVWIRLNEEGMDFGTAEPPVGWLLREAGDTKITEAKKKPEKK